MVGLSLAFALSSHAWIVGAQARDEPKSVTFPSVRPDIATDLKDPFRSGRRATRRPAADLKDPFGPGATPSRSFEPSTRAALRDPFADGHSRTPRCSTSEGVVIQRPNGLPPRPCKAATPPLRDPFEAQAAQ
jgi:hypothetical protein